MKISDDVDGSADRTTIDRAFRTTFDRLCTSGRTAVLDGSHQADMPPSAGGRWGLSTVVRFDAQTQQRLAGWTDELQSLAGPAHWSTGGAGSAHMTVRAIEPHRPDLAAGDALVDRCGGATDRAAVQVFRPVVYRLQGVALSPACVMACFYPVDGAAGGLAAAVRGELGRDGWLEESYSRTIWYASMLHFTGRIGDPHGLVDWVAERRDVKAADALAAELQLVTYRHDGSRMEPLPLRQASLPKG